MGRDTIKYVLLSLHVLQLILPCVPNSILHNILTIDSMHTIICTVCYTFCAVNAFMILCVWCWMSGKHSHMIGASWCYICFIFCRTEGGGLGGGAGICDWTKRKTHQGEHHYITSDSHQTMFLWRSSIFTPLAVQEEEALSYVAGFTVANDVTARDWQMKRNGKQWLLGKTFDSFCPLGPALVTTDAVKGEREQGTTKT